MKSVLIGGPQDGRELKEAEIITASDGNSELIKVLHVESLHDKKVIDVYVLNGKDESGTLRYRFHGNTALKERR